MQFLKTNANSSQTHVSKDAANDEILSVEVLEGRHLQVISDEPNALLQDPWVELTFLSHIVKVRKRRSMIIIHSTPDHVDDNKEDDLDDDDDSGDDDYGEEEDDQDAHSLHDLEFIVHSSRYREIY